MPKRIVSSTSGNGLQGALGASCRRARRVGGAGARRGVVGREARGGPAAPVSAVGATARGGVASAASWAIEALCGGAAGAVAERLRLRRPISCGSRGR